jgi:hypothetical protein
MDLKLIFRNIDADENRGFGQNRLPRVARAQPSLVDAGFNPGHLYELVTLG